MKRGDIFFANLDPTVGAEIKKKRPVIIVSNDENNKYSNTVTIVPLTSNTKRLYPFEVFIKRKFGLSKDSKAQCQQIRTVSKIRMMKKKIGSVNNDTLQKIEIALKIHLDM